MASPDMVVSSYRGLIRDNRRCDEMRCWTPETAETARERGIDPASVGYDGRDFVSANPRLGGRASRFEAPLRPTYGANVHVRPLSYDTFADPEAFGCPNDPRAVGRFRQMCYVGMTMPYAVASIGMSESYSRFLASDALRQDYRNWYDNVVKTLYAQSDYLGANEANHSFEECGESAHATKGWHMLVIDTGRDIPHIEAAERLLKTGVIDERLLLTDEQVATVEARHERERCFRSVRSAMTRAERMSVDIDELSRQAAMSSAAARLYGGGGGMGYG